MALFKVSESSMLHLVSSGKIICTFLKYDTSLLKFCFWIGVDCVAWMVSSVVEIATLTVLLELMI